LAAAGPAPAPSGANAPAPAGGGPATATGGAPQAAPSSATTDPVVASVDGHPITLSDLRQAEQTLPPELRNMPFASLYPVLLDRVVDHQALVMLARRRGLEDNPAVKQQIRQATEQTLEGALLGLDAVPKVTDEAIKARYDQLYAHHADTEQIRARHILVGTEAEADKIIADLKNGADFAVLAKQVSKDSDGQKGGELGFFSRAQVSAGFADVAFSLRPGQVTEQPIHNEFGWHVVQVEERRTLAPPSYADAHDALRDQLMQEAVHQEVVLARSQLIIHELNLDGSSRDPDARPAGIAAPPK
jgi:peptidyl-prolyl cis-trans isomerase C